MRRAILLALASLAVAASGVALWTVLRPTRPNVILITVDTLRADRLSCYGYTKHRTPSFDRPAAEGVRFANAFCDVTWTTPSMASVMTGRYATVHGLRTSFQLRTPRWKFVMNDPVPFVDVPNAPPVTGEDRNRYYSEELYDLEADPDETANVIAAHGDLGATFLRQVWDMQPEVESLSEPMDIDEETRRRLRSLGYLAD